MTYKWNANKQGNWQFLEMYDYVEDDGMPRMETRVLGGANYNGDYWMAWAMEDHHRLTLRSRIRVEDAKDDVMMFLQQRGLMSVAPSEFDASVK